MLLASKDEDTEVKIADFGLSKIISKQVMMQTACGTPGYVAPEVLSATGYEKEVDMWSIGVRLFLFLLCFAFALPLNFARLILLFFFR